MLLLLLELLSPVEGLLLGLELLLPVEGLVLPELLELLPVEGLLLEAEFPLLQESPFGLLELLFSLLLGLEEFTEELLPELSLCELFAEELLLSWLDWLTGWPAEEVLLFSLESSLKPSSVLSVVLSLSAEITGLSSLIFELLLSAPLQAEKEAARTAVK